MEIIPSKASVDEEHRAVGMAGRPRRRADGIGGLAHQRGLIAGDQVHGREAALQSGGQLLGPHAHAAAPATAPAPAPAARRILVASYSPAMRSTSAATLSTS